MALSRAEAALADLLLLSTSPDLANGAAERLAAAIAALQSVVRDAQAERLRYEGLFNALPDPISILDDEGRILDLNVAGMTAYGMARDALVGKLVHVINPDLPRDHMKPVLDVLNQGQSYVIEVTNMRSDGSRFPVEVHSAAFIDRGERHIVAVARDLSRRHEAERRYRQLMESIDKGILIQDANGRILSGNPAAMRMFGIDDGDSLADALSLDKWLIVDERGQPVPFEELPPVRALRSGLTIESTLLGLYHHRDKQLTWLSVTSVPQYAADGSRPHMVISLFSDVTSLKRDSALFDRAQSLASIGGWEWDAARGGLYLTNEALRIMGREDDPPSDLPEALRLVAPHDRPAVEQAVSRLLREGGSFDLEVFGHRPDGQALWARMIGEAERRGPMTTRITGTVQDITQRKLEEDRLRVLSRTDPLTGLLNRDGMMSELATRLAREDGDTALFYIDLDRFKMVNDVLGHGAGDQTLIAAARRLQRAVGDGAALARFGGDEFLVVADPTSLDDTPERVAARINAAFADSFRVGEEDFSITASVGLACASDAGRHPEELLSNADAAMYDAKRRGRNTWQRFNPGLARRQQDRVQIESQLRRALDDDEFHLVYQPMVSLHDGRVRGAEALLRWRHRTLGEIMPDNFIGQAEATGDIVRIGAWVIGQACHQICAWRKSGLPIERVSVNVSHRQFLGEELPQIVAAALGKCDLPGSILELEITERVLIEEAPDILATFAALRALGVSLVIDDFGEGYSALNYLRRLPIQGIKLSRQFLQGVPENRSDVAICQAVAGMAKGLGLSVVAEGVETIAQRDFMLDLGIEQGQGFLYSRGLPPLEMTEYLRRPSR
ncbi:sensor domain-containing protein [Arenimonas oryziterrae]|uniref:Diguanylate cyclase n=1 Tax=Arenimonas oryziterrae DSM 21050 = YC6267 TaxID=1121015 RepID=A0A091B9E9_9GAMM|nr:EAL domain-containing protein [Arenimonas oryziterrae]KFN41075.1 hypothetical protein N789_04100 [Arenimonas oryziterrae DSM 21050 = YC6267]